MIEQTTRLCGHRVVPAFAPGVTARQATQGQVAAGRSAVLLQCLKRISRAGGLETAGTSQPGAQEETIAAHQCDQKLPRQRMQGAQHGGASGRHDTTCCIGQHRGQLFAGTDPQIIRRRTVKARAAKRGAQAHNPQAMRKTLLVSGHAPYLPFEQVSCHRATGMTLRDHRTQPTCFWPGFIHSHALFRCLAC